MHRKCIEMFHASSYQKWNGGSESLSMPRLTGALDGKSPVQLIHAPTMFKAGPEEHRCEMKLGLFHIVAASLLS